MPEPNLFSFGMVLYEICGWADVCSQAKTVSGDSRCNSPSDSRSRHHDLNSAVSVVAGCNYHQSSGGKTVRKRYQSAERAEKKKKKRSRNASSRKPIRCENAAGWQALIGDCTARTRCG